jgi:hypothetical protein
MGRFGSYAEDVPHADASYEGCGDVVPNCDPVTCLRFGAYLLSLTLSQTSRLPAEFGREQE